MAQFDYDIGIIGGGAAGLTVTAGAAQLGAKTLLVEKEKELGGDCLHYGCVPSKTLIKSAHVYYLMKHAERFGLPRVDMPAVDFKDIRKRIQSVISVIQKHDSVERFSKLGARVGFGDASFTNEHTIELKGEKHSAKTWVIATGSSPFVPPIQRLESTEFITNKEMFYLDSLPQSLIIIGAGPIGIEMAQAFNRLGSRVTVIDMAPHILTKEDNDMADELMAILQEEGVTFHLNISVIRTQEVGREKEVIIKDKKGKEMSLKAETLLVAVGRAPNVQNLGLEKIGVLFDKKGIKTNDQLKTNHNHIYAAGDVNGGPQFTHAAGYQGGIVISNAIFHLPRKVNYAYMPWCTYTHPELASIGMNEKRAQAAGITYSLWTEKFKANDRSLAEGESEGKIKMLVNKQGIPIGVQILGPHAGDLVSEWVAVCNGKVKLSTLAGSIHPYPTFGEINKRVAGLLFSKKLFSDKVRKGLKFFFRYRG